MLDGSFFVLFSSAIVIAKKKKNTRSETKNSQFVTLQIINLPPEQSKQSAQWPLLE